MSSEVPLSSALAVGAAQGGGGAPAAFSSAAMFLANPAGRCSGAGWCGSGACAFAAGLAGPQSAPNKYPRELCPPPLLPPRTIVSGCLSVFQKTTTLNRQIRSIRLTYHITPTSKPNQKPSPITPPPNNTHHNAIHHSLTSPSPVNPNSSPMTPKPQTYRSHIYPLSHNSPCYSLNPQNHDTQTTTPLPISQISIPHIHTKDQQPLHTSIPTHTNNIPASRITLPLHRSSMPHY
jgi:hypothetical protein